MDKILQEGEMRQVEKEVLEQPVPKMPEFFLDPKKLRESRLIAFGDRITYTFAMGKEVASIHFDRLRGEIFYKGHSIRNMDLQPWHVDLLKKFSAVLKAQPEGRRFEMKYSEALGKILSEKNL